MGMDMHNNITGILIIEGGDFKMSKIRDDPYQVVSISKKTKYHFKGGHR
jgi:hypothetical protein